MLLNSLYLAPVDPDHAPTSPPILEVLRRLAVIGEPLNAGSYLAGAGFARHIVFAGCSPHLVLTPPEDGSQAFSHVAVHGPFESRCLVIGAHAVKPRCPHCRRRITGWRERVGSPAAWQDWRCTDCGRLLVPCELDWRQHAVCGRLLIELRNVFPGEAAPSDTLLRELQVATDVDWQYGWAAYFPSAADGPQSTTT